MVSMGKARIFWFADIRKNPAIAIRSALKASSGEAIKNQRFK